MLDTGANFAHPDLNGRLNNGTDFCPKITAQGACQGQDNDSTDIPTTRPSGGHGTHAAGIIAAKTNNNAGIAGIVARRQDSGRQGLCQQHRIRRAERRFHICGQHRPE
ncbi:MAG: S8 family serine peptidase [Pleurocapsa sp. SU_196_0]|nr:S8 family serine peptidase [Pleurocapsa sp. SU_196_0]